MNKGAILSNCGKYRYQLWRIWDDRKPYCLFIMHNPSRADANIDDPTIRRCIGFAAAWGYGGIYVGNISPYRCTDPKEMLHTNDVLVPLENFWYVMEMALKCKLHVLAYGIPVSDKILPFTPKRFNFWHYLKQTAGGHPCHPLYLKKTLTPMKFNEQ